METKHTPIPYYVAESGGGYAIRVSSVTLGKPIHYDATVAVLSCDPITEPQAKETAEFIVNACNSHHDLLEALQAFLAWKEEHAGNILSMVANRDPFGTTYTATKQSGTLAEVTLKARAAIAKATNP